MLKGPSHQAKNLNCKAFSSNGEAFIWVKDSQALLYQSQNINMSAKKKNFLLILQITWGNDITEEVHCLMQVCTVADLSIILWVNVSRVNKLVYNRCVDDPGGPGFLQRALHTYTSSRDTVLCKCRPSIVSAVWVNDWGHQRGIITYSTHW
jgi:hypothetical protein